MIVARELALIARVESIEWIDDSGQPFFVDFTQPDNGLFCNDLENAIYFLPLKKSKAAKIPAGRKQLKKAYRSFVGFNPDAAFEITIPNDRTELKKIGYIQKVIYVSDKWTGDLVRYGHDYKTEVILYSDRKTIPAMRIFGAMSKNGARLVSARGLIQ